MKELQQKYKKLRKLYERQIEITDEYRKEIISLKKERDELKGLLETQNEVYNEMLLAKALTTTENVKLKEEIKK